jgi:acyl-CoA reductase-like NAD-dependent aldehyde dehydrogenase
MLTSTVVGLLAAFVVAANAAASAATVENAGAAASSSSFSSVLLSHVTLRSPAASYCAARFVDMSPYLVLIMLALFVSSHRWSITYRIRLVLEGWLLRIPALDVPFPPVPTPSSAGASSSSSSTNTAPLISPTKKSDNGTPGKSNDALQVWGSNGKSGGGGGLLLGPSVACPALLDPTRPGFLQCWNPANGQYLGQVPAMDAADVDAVVQKAAQAQQQWKKTTFAQRRQVLRTIQQFLIRHMDEVCTASALDSGKPLVDAVLGEVLTTCEKIDAVCRHGERWLQPESRSTSLLTLHKSAWVEYVPMGVLATIAPWNYPFHNMINHVVSGIFAGNAVVGKVSEHTSWCSHHYYAPIIQAALVAHGHDPHLCPLVTGLGDAGHALCSHPLVDKIIFTGSPEIGRKVMLTASHHLKPVILELGGKDAFCVLDDADLKAAVPFAMRGCFQNCGQNCVGIERVLVYESLHDRFVDQVYQRIRNLRTGCPLPNYTKSKSSSSDSRDDDPIVDCGALVMREQLRKIQDLVDDAVQQGAKVLCGGVLAAPDVDEDEDGNSSVGQFYPPTLLVNVTPQMKIFHTEVFGPVMTVTVVPRDSDEACAQLANATSFGLGSTVFTSNRRRGLALGRQFRSGMLCVNDFQANYLVQSLPFGGVNESGFGRFAGIEGLRALCLERSIVTDKFPLVRTTIPPILDYPVKPSTYRFATSLIQFLYDESLVGKLRGIFGLIKNG